MGNELYEQFMQQWNEKAGKGFGFFDENHCWPPVEQTSIQDALKMFNIWLKENGKLCGCP